MEEIKLVVTEVIELEKTDVSILLAFLDSSNYEEFDCKNNERIRK